MTTRPTRIAQTTKEARKAYKKNGPRIPEREHKQLQRLAELDNRAAKAREQEERRKGLKRKREEKDRKEREARKQLGVGLATQVCGYSHTQKKLKSGMEAFLGLKKKEANDKIKKEEEEARLKEKLEAIVEEMEKEPWDDSEGDDAMADLPVLDATVELEGDHWIDDDLDDGSLLEAQDLPILNATIELEGDHWIDDDLDDCSLLEAHDLLMSDTVDELLDTPSAQAPPPLPAQNSKVAEPAACKPHPSSVPIVELNKSSACKDDPEYIRIHGPINKVIEDSLKLLPECLVELLSQDVSVDPSKWGPAPSLLHKLNPVGLPPHRLRLKVGCIVSLLRDLNTSSQLSKSSHLMVLRIENEWLECLVLDGQLEGTKAFLSRVAFPAKYRNEDKFAFRRKQFPIRVSTKHAHLSQGRAIPQSTFKIPSIAGQAPKPSGIFKKPAMPVPKAKPPSNSNPSFKRPGLPASRAANPPAPLALTLTLKYDVPTVVMDGWDDFLDSATQIARDLSSDDPAPTHQPKPATVINTFVPLSTQDLDFDMDDLEDVVQPAFKPPNLNQQVKIVTKSMPRKAPYVSPPNPLGKILGHKIHPKPSMAHSPRHLQKSNSAVVPARVPMPPPPRPTPQPVRRGMTNVSKPSPAPPLKQSPMRSIVAPKALPATKSLPSFSEFGLSTQDAVSFFDDDDDDGDEMAFGSSLITV